MFLFRTYTIKFNYNDTKLKIIKLSLTYIAMPNFVFCEKDKFKHVILYGTRRGLNYH